MPFRNFIGKVQKNITIQTAWTFQIKAEALLEEILEAIFRGLDCSSRIDLRLILNHAYCIVLL